MIQNPTTRCGQYEAVTRASSRYADLEDAIREHLTVVCFQNPNARGTGEPDQHVDDGAAPARGGGPNEDRQESHHPRMA